MLLTAWSDYPVVTIHRVISQVRKQEWRRRLEERQQEVQSFSRARPSAADSPRRTACCSVQYWRRTNQSVSCSTRPLVVEGGDGGPLDIYMFMYRSNTEMKTARCSVASSLAYVPLRRIAPVCTRLRRRLDIIIAKNSALADCLPTSRSDQWGWWQMELIKNKTTTTRRGKNPELSHRCSIPFHRRAGGKR